MSAAATLAGLARTQDYHRKSRAEKGFQDLSRSRFRPLYTLHGIRTGRSPPHCNAIQSRHRTLDTWSGRHRLCHGDHEWHCYNSDALPHF
ncbi:hypothetical protein PSTG_08680 [Puccinia striiformis f. sp. tritici PST-78]|uniref:Uncharacterized protein n=1 Tax=Puccinia striiformis f. sp. tritici PST-78 TaxID=1165861 RepID=A0A0L0VFP6_9BASI|nr:hypothetical protein PSTG_08680 [Puccinia striiformis f. sp. tritici PST-78]